MAPLVLKTNNGPDIPLLALSPLTGIDQAEQKQELLASDTLTIVVKSTSPLDITIGQTLPIYGQLYTLNQLPGYTKLAEKRYEYEVVLEGPQYHLIRPSFFDTDVNGKALSSVFSLTGNLQFFAEVLFNNMARVFGGAWGLGNVGVPGESTNTGSAGSVIPGDQTDTKTLSFENENCLGVLQRLCAEWGTEFTIDYRPNDAPNRILNVGPAGQVLPDVFRYGQGNALYKISRRTVQQTPFYTRAYIFGGSKNIPAGYRGLATRLQLPQTGINPSPTDAYVQDTDAIAKYGLIEGTKVFEDIYPHRTGVVTGLGGTVNYFQDSTVDFNPFAYDTTEIVNGQERPVYKYIAKGITPKVSFLTGDLAGYTFDLVSFFANNNLLLIKAYKDEQGLVFPSDDPDSPFKIKEGDTYVFVDMKMPDEYVDLAEGKLLAAGRAWLAENGAPSVEYSLELDQMYLQKRANDTGPIPLDNPPNFFTVGDSIRLIDTDLDIDQMLRVTGFSRDGLKPYAYTLTLGDTRKISKLQRTLAQQTRISQIASPSTAKAPATATVPPAVKAEIEAVKETIVTQSNGIKYTLGLAALPPGFIPARGANLSRQQMLVEVVTSYNGTGDKTRAGIIGAIARKRPPR